MIKLTGLAKAIAFLSLAGVATAANPVVMNPKNMTYSAGDTMEIVWSNATTGFVNIDLVSTNPNVLQFPLMIASGVSGEECKYRWKIPAELKTAAGYYLRVWGTNQPPAGAPGSSPMFTVMNQIPDAVNTFVVLAPNKEKPCALGGSCKIAWDYVDTSRRPAMVDIILYRVGNPAPVLYIATVDSSLKSYTWQVPNDPALMTGDVYISVSGQGTPLLGPKMSNDMGGNSGAFVIAKEEIVEVTSTSTCSTTSSRTTSTSSSTTTSSRVSAARKDDNASAAPYTTSEFLKIAAIIISLIATVPFALIL